MLRIRKAEEAIVALYPEQQIRCPTHLAIGQEAVAVGVCAALETRDTVFSGHRCHAHYLAKGGTLRGMFAELYGKAAGCCGGKGGSMHLAAPEAGMLGASAIVAGSVPLAVGAALAARMTGADAVAVAFFGDAGIEQGVTHESLAFAALRRLPVLFVCENNGYATHSPIAARQVSPDIAPRAAAYGIPGVAVDGNDVIAVYRAALAAVRRARRGEGPTLLEAKTYRWREHVGPNFDVELGYRTQAEIDAWRARDPVARHGARLARLGVLTPAARARLEAGVDAEVADAVTFAKESPFPEAEAMYRDVE
jgi:pyruvate dehydrogenase E1 component alpha subunit